MIEYSPSGSSDYLRDDEVDAEKFDTEVSHYLRTATNEYSVRPTIRMLLFGVSDRALCHAAVKTAKARDRAASLALQEAGATRKARAKYAARTAGASANVSYTDALKVSEFRALWLADAQSAAGDQLARVALSVLVFERTASAVLTAFTYALTFLPALIGGAVLSRWADRVPRRRVMVSSDLFRAALLALMALPGSPIGLLWVLLVAAVLIGSPFIAAESALLPEILTDEYYVVGASLRTITNQLAQVAGFALGGLTVAAFGTRLSLAVDATTFGLSALLVMVGVRYRPAPAKQRRPDESADYRTSILGGIRRVADDPKLRILLGFSWLLGLYVVPEGVATPYAESLGAGPVGVGLLMAAGPAGTALGTYLFVRLVPIQARSHWIGSLTVAGGLPLAACVMYPSLVLSIGLWALSGAAAAYQVQVVTEYVRETSNRSRAQAVGLAASGLLAAQGIGILLGGIIAGPLGSNRAVSLAGILIITSGAILGVRWARLIKVVHTTESGRLASNGGELQLWVPPLQPEEAASLLPAAWGQAPGLIAVGQVH
jgi:MFS family permease